jgi:hypothetical protein
MNNSSAILIMTCDKTYDVFSHFKLAFQKYWPNRNLKLFIGANSNSNVRQLTKLDNVEIILTPRSDWGNESIFQLQYIKENYPNFSHILVFLDDFILNEKVDQSYFEGIVKIAQSDNLKYLRLKRLEGSLFDLFAQNMLRNFLFPDQKHFRISNLHPYYSSLQVALWEIDHLVKFINRSKDIWDFEHLIDNENPHFSVYKDCFSYKHIVEKGEWEIYAKQYCLKYISYFDEGSRPTRPRTFLNVILHFITTIKFELLGYSVLRLKNYFK